MNVLGVCLSLTKISLGFVVWIIQWFAYIGLLLLLPVSSQLNFKLEINMVIKKYHCLSLISLKTESMVIEPGIFLKQLLWWSLIT